MRQIRHHHQRSSGLQSQKTSNDHDTSMHTLILRCMPQEDRSKLDERMMQSVKRASRDADAMLVIIDASDRPEQTLTFLDSTFKEATVPTAVILNKARACQLSSLSVHHAGGAFSGHAGLTLSSRSRF